MLKNLTRLECKIGERVFHFYTEIDVTLDHVKEALFQFQKMVGQIEDRILEAQKLKDAQKQPEEPAKEEVKDDSTAS